MTNIKPGDKIKIRQAQVIPGFGGLNFNSLREDGWEPSTVLTVEFVSGAWLTAKWGDGKNQRRTLWLKEIEPC